MGHGLKTLALGSLAAFAMGTYPASSIAKSITLTFNEVDFGTGGGLVDPLPSNAYASYGVLMSNFYWGTDMRDPFGDAQRGISGQFGTTPTINFLRETPFVEFEYWTVAREWEIFVRAYDADNSQVGSFIGSGYWEDGGGNSRIVGPKIEYITVLCREAATGISYGCGSVAFSTLNFVRAPEPGTLALFALGLVALGFSAQRRLH
jgi:PEP-CTERM motif